MKYKNTLLLKEKKTGETLRRELAAEPLDTSSLLPDTVLLEDIDKAFKEWTDKEIEINFEGKDIPTIALFTSQRFSEYMQSWENVDDKKNFLMNFKVITRDNNPKPGTLYGESRNIPGDRYYSVNQYITIDKNGRQALLDYQMKQPYCVDISYDISIVTNKLRLLNQANELINDVFKSITSYLNVKGHYMPMTLGEISDESEYQIDDRQYYSQTFPITVKGYIINEDSLRVLEKPLVKYSYLENGFSGGDGSWVEIEDLEPSTPEERKKYEITIQLDKNKNTISFTCDTDMTIYDFEVDNILSYMLDINDNEVFRYSIFTKNEKNSFPLKNGDEVKIRKAVKEEEAVRPGTIILKGYGPQN